MIRSGELNKRVTLERWESADDPRWGAGGGYIAFDEVWAGIQPRAATEVPESKSQQQTKITHDVKMRYRPDVDSKVRIRWGTRVLEIISALDVEARGRELKIEAVESPENG